MTPLLAKWLAGHYVPVDALGLFLSTVKIVLAPVIIRVLPPVWSSAFRRLGIFITLYRVNAELRTELPLATEAYAEASAGRSSLIFLSSNGRFAVKVEFFRHGTER